VIEENTIVGNTNGIFVASGVKGNIFRQNLVVGNPGVQVSVDHTSNNGFDIQNLAIAGANAFEGNTCVTGLNAPCPSVGPSLTADPNPIPVAAGATVGQTTLSWSAPDAQYIEIHVGSPSGPLFTEQGNRGSIQTGVWVADGATFYLQDVTGGKPPTSDYTLATLVVHLQASGTNGQTPALFRGVTHNLSGVGAVALMLAISLILAWRRIWRRRVWTGLSGAALLLGLVLSMLLTGARAQSQPTPQQTAATLDRMIAAHKSQQELAQYVFDTHGCKTCHTVGQNGKLGFTSRGQQAGVNYEGCIRLLTDANLIAKLPESRLSDQQRHEAARFKEFGCTFCHNVGTNNVGLTPVGAKLTHLHLGCVDIEKQLARAGVPPR
jgi:parallel beta-helix repeat protein